MQTTELFAAIIDYDAEATAAGYRGLEPLDEGCCDACAAFAEMVRRGALPEALTAALRRLGIDPAKAQEVYGIPEVGVIAGWWLFVGSIQAVWTGRGGGAFQEVGPGLRCWVTDRLVVHAWPDRSRRMQLVQVEFEWRDASVARGGTRPRRAL